jgi:hypothetical protein
MEQIRSDQIIPTKVADNTVIPIPRDLGQVIGINRKKLGLVLPDPSGTSSNPDVPTGGDAVEVINPGSSIPSTPQLIAIKSQSVNIKPDGTTVIDVILDIEDVRNAVEYEVRIAKGAGNL